VNVVLKLVDISKTYPGGIKALNKVSFDLKEGEIHALLGENGAGKTTLIKILSGNLRPDEGKILYSGVEISFKSPLDAISRGIGTVHQHPLLIPYFTVNENIKLYETLLKQKFSTDEISEILKMFKISKDILNKKVADIPSGIRQKIELLKVLISKPRIILLDEPTASLTPTEVEELFSILSDLRGKGKSIVFVTHKVKEAIRISDRITILRKGEKIATFENKGDLQEEVLATLIVGDVSLSQGVRLVKSTQKSIESDLKNSVLEIKNLHAKDDLGIYKLKGFSLKLKKGETLAIVGVAGNGQKELVECLVGLRRFDKGIIRYFNTTYARVVNFCEVVRKHRVSYITEDRIYTGVAKDLDFLTNIALRDICLERKSIFLNKNQLINKAREIIAKYDIKAPNEKVQVSQLSGGNIQKLITARELEINPLLIIAEQPTQGLDIKTTNFVRSLLASKKGTVSILLVTYDLEEALLLADRIVVIYDGKNVAEHAPVDIDTKKLSLEMLGVVA